MNVVQLNEKIRFSSEDLFKINENKIHFQDENFKIYASRFKTNMENDLNDPYHGYIFHKGPCYVLKICKQINSNFLDTSELEKIIHIIDGMDGGAVEKNSNEFSLKKEEVHQKIKNYFETNGKEPGVVLQLYEFSDSKEISANNVSINKYVADFYLVKCIENSYEMYDEANVNFSNFDFLNYKKNLFEILKKVDLFDSKNVQLYIPKDKPQRRIYSLKNLIEKEIKKKLDFLVLDDAARIYEISTAVIIFNNDFNSPNLSNISKRNIIKKYDDSIYLPPNFYVLKEPTDRADIVNSNN